MGFPEGIIGNILSWYWWYLKFIINWRCLLSVPVKFLIELIAVAFSAIGSCFWIICLGVILPIFVILFFYYLLVEIIKEIRDVILRKYWIFVVPFQLVFIMLTYAFKTLAFLFCRGERPWGNRPIE